MKKTQNYQLSKPDYSDTADVAVLNGNMDILDKLIKDLFNMNFTEEQARKIFSLLNHVHNEYLLKTETAANSQKLDNLDSLDFMRSYRGEGNVSHDLGIAKYLRWKHYGQNHIIFDASNATTPSGRRCDRTNPEQGWASANCPTLMGWNGRSTYGVRVANSGWADGANNSNSVQGFPFRNNNGMLEVLIKGEWLSVGAKQYTVTREGTVRQGQFFEYRGGAGALRGFMTITRNFQLFVDDVLINEINAICQESSSDWKTLQNEIEFKNSIKFVIPQSANDSLSYFIQTER